MGCRFIFIAPVQAEGGLVPSYIRFDARVPWRGVADGLTAAISGEDRIGQTTMAGNPTTGSWLKAATVSSVM
jgi:hypothetical protein